MTIKHWTDFVKALDKFFERKLTDTETAMLWYQEVQHLPAEFLPWASSQVRGNEYFPRNLPFTVKNLWGQWLRENPQKRAREDNECPGCSFGRGWISVWRQPKTYEDLHNAWVRFAVRCALCNPVTEDLLDMQKKSGERPIKVSTIDRLEEDGYILGPNPAGGYGFVKQEGFDNPHTGQENPANFRVD